MQNLAFKFQAIAEKTAKNVRGLLYFAAPYGCAKCLKIASRLAESLRQNSVFHVACTVSIRDRVGLVAFSKYLYVPK